jgi:hypothetical protein
MLHRTTLNLKFRATGSAVELSGFIFRTSRPGVQPNKFMLRLQGGKHLATRRAFVTVADTGSAAQDEAVPWDRDKAKTRPILLEDKYVNHGSVDMDETVLVPTRALTGRRWSCMLFLRQRTQVNGHVIRERTAHERLLNHCLKFRVRLFKYIIQILIQPRHLS